MTRTNKNAGSRAGVREDMQQLLLSDGHLWFLQEQKGTLLACRGISYSVRHI